MIARLSGKIASYFVFHGIIDKDDEEVYEYSLEVLISTVLSLIVLLVLALATGTFFYTTLFLLGFIPLRLNAGGYHAKDHLRCFIVLMFTYTAFLLLMHMLPYVYMTTVAASSAMLSVIAVFLLAPSEDSNKPLSADEMIPLKKRSRIVIVGYAVVVCLLSLFVPETKYAFSLALGNLTVALSLFANYLKNKLGKR